MVGKESGHGLGWLGKPAKALVLAGASEPELSMAFKQERARSIFSKVSDKEIGGLCSQAGDSQGWGPRESGANRDGSSLPDPHWVSCFLSLLRRLGPTEIRDPGGTTGVWWLPEQLLSLSLLQPALRTVTLCMAKLCSKKVCYWATASALWFSVQERGEFIELQGSCFLVFSPQQ